MQDLDKVTRLEIIDHRPCHSCRGRRSANYLQEDGSYKEMPCDVCQGMGSAGRQVVFWNKETKIESSIQDDGQTLKIFIDSRTE